jgi:hypothetical protein
MSCETEQAQYDFPACWEGGSLEAFSIAIDDNSGNALVSAEMVFKAGGSDTALLTLSSGDGLTVASTTAGAWVVTVDQINAITLAPGIYYYHLKTVDAASLTEFYVAGTWQIKNV